MEHYMEIWQRATIDDSRVDRVYRAEDLVPQIMKLVRSQEKLIRFKTLSTVILMLTLVIIFLNTISLTVFSILGIGIFVASLLVVLVLLNRLRFQITVEERSFTTMQLAETTEHKINTERKIFTRYLPLFIAVALIGINVMYVDIFRGEETGTRIFYHAILTGSIAVAAVVGLSVRIRRFHKQFLPLLGRIRKFIEESES